MAPFLFASRHPVTNLTAQQVLSLDREIFLGYAARLVLHRGRKSGLFPGVGADTAGPRWAKLGLDDVSEGYGDGSRVQDWVHKRAITACTEGD
ncbi:uncharacterized protein DNG_02673 [Cephalotrichum gorgonifer]|uniref:Uncharacterized protein n=1 Tax=Cephalotrichum gorgonifer TaxID=2041049 RepID=A0AAE8MTM0_9PEZI|nr:uncharacterized protein DNG_02673 [Cephalotrichum gorgonifer]